MNILVDFILMRWSMAVIISVLEGDNEPPCDVDDVFAWLARYLLWSTQIKLAGLYII